MKLATFRTPAAAERLGVAVDGAVVDLAAAAQASGSHGVAVPALTDALAFLTAGDSGRELAASVVE